MEGSALGTAVADRLREAAAALAIDLGDAPAGRLDELSGTLAATLTSVQDAAGACLEAIQASAATEDEDPQKMAAARVTLASLDDCSAPPAGSWTRSARRSPSGARWSGWTGRSWRIPAGRRRCGWRRSRSAGSCGTGCSPSARWR
jgi:hypothetical protein